MMKVWRSEKEQLQMTEPDIDVEKNLRELLELLDIQRAEVAKMVDDCSNNPHLYDELPSLKAARAKLDRAATELQWVLDTGLEKGSGDDPRRTGRTLIAQHNLLCVWLKTLSEVIAELNGEGEAQEESTN